MTDDGPYASDNSPLETEDVELLWQAIARAEAVLDDLDAGDSTTADFDALLGYLHEVVLARISEEERQLFSLLREAGETGQADAARLHDDHLLLRDDVDDLAAAAAPHADPDAGQLAIVIRRLIVRLDQHLRAEAAALARLPGGYQASNAQWTTQQQWYPLTEGTLIDLDQLPADQADDAVLNRLTHLRLGDQVDLQSRHTHPQRLRDRLQRRAPGEFTWSERRDVDDGWLVSITRRMPD